MKPQDQRPSVLELLEGAAGALDAAAVLGPMFPGLLLCVPGLVLFAAPVVVPIVALVLLAAVVVALSAAVVLPSMLAVRLGRMVVRRVSTFELSSRAAADDATALTTVGTAR